MIMKKLIVIALLFLSACTSLDRGFDNLILAQKYVPGTEDLPVYDGFQTVDTKNVVYDSESGRIIEASYFRRDVTEKEVRDFYNETLPQLGWHKNKPSQYTRDGESLKLNIGLKNGVVSLKFNIRPVG